VNKIFKVIKHKSFLGANKVVSELASSNIVSSDERSHVSTRFSCTLLDNLKLSTRHTLSIIALLSMLPQLATADIIADANAPLSQQPTILNTASGATQVNIQTPTQAGVSMNQYSQFDTQTNGTVLNNSRVNAQTQSAGWVEGNPWLATGEANVIVNQVNSNDPSLLQGTIEVAGSKADVIIANPSGITMDGVSILNASGMTFTTGNVQTQEGSVTGYDVSKGTIKVEGGGLNASGADYTEIISRAAEINANIHAKDLKVITGANKVSKATSTITAQSGEGLVPTVSIDTKALGGMYAGQITLVSTERGVGVNNEGVIAATNFTLSADGKLTNAGTIVSQDTVKINTASLTNTKTIASNNNIAIKSQNEIDNQGNISALREVKVTTQTLNNSGEIEASRLDIASKNLTNSGGTIAQAGLNSLTLSAADITNTNAALLGSHEEDPTAQTNPDDTTSEDTTDSGATVTTGEVDVSTTSPVTWEPLAAGSIAVEEGIINDGGEISAADVTLDVDNTLLNGSGSLINVATLNHQGTTLQNQDATIFADTFTSLSLVTFNNLNAQIEANTELLITAESFDNTKGSLLSYGSMGIDADSIINQEGLIQSTDILELNALAGSLDNTLGVIFSSQGDLSVTAQDSIQNQNGVIASAGMLYMSAENSIENTSGLIQSSGATDIESGSLSIDDGEGMILSADMMHIKADSIINLGTLSSVTAQVLDAATLVTNGGEISSQGTLEINTQTLANNGGEILSNSDITIQTDGLDNADGFIVSDQIMNIHAQSIDNTGTKGGKGISANTLDVTTETLDNTNGSINAFSSLFITALQVIDNTNGEILSEGTLGLFDSNGAAPLGKMLTITNTNGLISADSTIIDAASLGNDGAAEGNSINISLKESYVNDGGLSVSVSLAFETLGDFTNNALLFAEDMLWLSAENISNEVTGEIASNEILLEGSSSIENRGTINSGTITKLNAPAISNIGSGVIYGDHIAIEADTLISKEETIDSVTKSAVIAARERLDIGAMTVINQEGSEFLSLGTLHIGGELDANNMAVGQADILNNLSARIESGSNMYLSAKKVNNLNLHLETMQVIDGTTDGVLVKPASGAGKGEWFNKSECTGIFGGQDDNTCGVIDEIAQRDALIQSYYDQIYATTDWSEQRNIYIAMYNDPEYISLNQVIKAATFEDYSVIRQYTTTSHTEVISTDPSQIISVGDLVIEGQLYNKDSHVIAAGKLEKTQNPVNEATKGQEIISYDGSTVQRTYVKACGLFGNSHCRKWSAQAPYEIEPVNGELYDLPTMVYQENATVQLIGNTQSYNTYTPASSSTNTQQAGDDAVMQPVNMQIREAAPNLAMPTSSLFSIGVDGPESIAPLIQTDSRFTDYAQWLSSDEMISALGVDPNTIIKRLGDGYYEMRLIQDQVIQLTGERYLDDYSSDTEQYKALMDSGVTFAQKYSLAPGVALSAEQITQLTSDIVWLVEEQVTLPDGTVTTALVPKLYVVAKEGDLDGNGALLSGNNVITNGTNELINSGTIHGRNLVSLSSESSISNLGGKIEANTLALYAQNDINNVGGTLDAQNAMVLDAGNNVNIASSTYESSSTIGKSSFSRTGIENVATVYVENPDGLLLMNAGNDITLDAADIKNQGDLTVVSAGNNVNVSTVTVSEQNNAVWDSKNHYKEGYTSQIGTNIQTNGDITVLANNDINVKAGVIESASSTVSLDAKNDINVESGIYTTNYDEATYIKSSGFLSSSKRTTIDTENTVTAQSAYIGGDKVLLNSGNDVTIKGSDVISDSGTVIAAANDVKITASEESVENTHFHEVKKSGLMGTGGVGFMIGSTKNSTDGKESATYNSGSMVGSLEGDTTIAAGNNYKQTASSVMSPNGDITIAAQEVNIEAGYDTYNGSSVTKSKSSGLTVALTGTVANIVSAAQDTANAASDIGESKHARVNAMAAANTAWNAYQTTEALQEAAADPTSVGVSITVGSSKSESKMSYKGTQAVSSTVAGENVSVIAAGAGEESDVNIIGSDVAGSVSTVVTAQNDVNILAAANTDEQHTSNKSSGWNAGVAITYGANGFAAGFTAGGFVGKGHGDGESTTYTNSHVGSTTSTTVVQAGETTTIKGGQVIGENVTLDTKNLTIESLQDTSVYDSKQQDASAQVTFGYGFSASGSYSKSNIDADYASVNEQSGVVAGDGGYQVTVAEHTDLKGGIITSTQKAEAEGLNSFSTGTLSVSDVENHMHYEGDSFGISTTASYSFKDPKTQTGQTTTTDTPKAGQKEGRFGVNKSVGYGSEGESQTSITKSAINTSNIKVTDQKAQKATGTSTEEIIAQVHTDTTTGTLETDSGALVNNFDAAEVQKELDVQTRVTQTFDTTRQEVKETIYIVANEKAKEAKNIRMENNGVDTEKSKKLDEEAQNLQQTVMWMDMVAIGIYSGASSDILLAAETITQIDLVKRSATADKKIILQKCDTGGQNCTQQEVDLKDIIIGEDGKIYIFNHGILNNKEYALQNAAQQSNDIQNAQGVYIIINPHTGNPVAEVLYAGYDKLNELVGGILPISNASEVNQDIRDIATEQEGIVVTIDHSRGSLTDSNAIADSLNNGETNLPIESATFNGAAANAQNMANRVNTATNGKGTVYQSTHTTDLVGTSIGSNEPTGGLDSYGFPDSHSSYGSNADEKKTDEAWGDGQKSTTILVSPTN
jgi:filamentous hemagglutinin